MDIFLVEIRGDLRSGDARSSIFGASMIASSSCGMSHAEPARFQSPALGTSITASAIFGMMISIAPAVTVAAAASPAAFG